MNLYNKSLHFKADSKEDIKYYVQSIVNLKKICFEEMEREDGSLIIHCSKGEMRDDRYNKYIKKINSCEFKGIIDFYDDPIHGTIIKIH